ncbi:hypothetical protein [Streptomyces rubradiris]|uniref:Secreted protein n=1 Tax=Streptomyces rubradiris TaxID=285531 RepID=A0ABQ3RP55_STRRR|nr:hypothetical protein [Streptomyces rubradiris]GHH12132.1 hypothetical protein GCM10018792_37220 [Streptomyces rubradiris]GHI57651.1 hypothetical protein Srubr_74970 [Streptomyces rubradiris]
MRVLPARRLASTVLCASVLAGITGPVALAADAAGEHGRTASRASVPAAQKERLLAQVRALGRTHPELGPVTDLLSRSLEAGRLPADEARRLGEAAKEAVTRATAARPATAAKPATPAAATPASPAAQAPAALPAAPVTARHAHVGAPVARDILDDVLGSLATAIENLVQAITGEAASAQTATDQVATTDEAATADASDPQLPALDGLLSGLLDLLTGLFGGGTKLAVTELPTPAGTTAATPASVPGPAPAG